VDSEELRDWLALSYTPGLGSGGSRALVEHCGGPGAALRAGQRGLAVPGVRKDVLAALRKGPFYRQADEELQRAAVAGVRILVWADPRYPELLRTIHNPPVLLYIKGRPELLQGPGIGVVGARAASEYGLQAAQCLASRLAERGLVVISGLALGIDSAAHRGALAVAGDTVAVLGCGVDIAYPAHNRRLYDQIAVQGALVSEYPLGTEPEPFRFPARNRIISGLGMGILVVEAARRSGSLITAHLALEQGREVFAVPGRVDSMKSEGAHRLLQEGAKLVHTVDDILEELPLSKFHQAGGGAIRDTAGPEPGDLGSDEVALRTFLDVYPKNIDQVILGTGLSAQRCCEALLLLELKGYVATLPGKRFQKIG
jgi:DNA processing protein